MAGDQSSCHAGSESLGVGLGSSSMDEHVKITGSHGDSDNKKGVEDFPISAEADLACSMLVGSTSWS